MVSQEQPEVDEHRRRRRRAAAARLPAEPCRRGEGHDIWTRRSCMSFGPAFAYQIGRPRSSRRAPMASRPVRPEKPATLEYVNSGHQRQQREREQRPFGTPRGRSACGPPARRAAAASSGVGFPSRISAQRPSGSQEVSALEQRQGGEQLRRWRWWRGGRCWWVGWARVGHLMGHGTWFNAGGIRGARRRCSGPLLPVGGRRLRAAGVDGGGDGGVQDNTGVGLRSRRRRGQARPCAAR